MRKIRLMLVDDHLLMRMGLATATGGEPDLEIVAEAEDGDEALQLYEQYRPDVVILDLRMDRVDGISFLTQLKKKHGRARVLVLSNYASGEDVMRAVKAGAAGYILKGTPLEQLLAAVRKIHDGGEFIPPEIAARFTRCVQSDLSDRELQVLTQIAQGKSNKEIANELHIVEGTVKVHVTNIFHKLQVEDRTQAVILAVRQHLVRVE